MNKVLRLIAKVREEKGVTLHMKDYEAIMKDVTNEDRLLFNQKVEVWARPSKDPRGGFEVMLRLRPKLKRGK